jgi:tellurium resistance protein TerD
LCLYQTFGVGSGVRRVFVSFCFDFIGCGPDIRVPKFHRIITKMQYRIVLEYSLFEGNVAAYLELSAFLLGANDKVVGKRCFVYYGNPSSDNNAVRFDNNTISNVQKNKKDSIIVDVNSIPANIHKIVFAVNAKADNNTPKYIEHAKRTGVCSLFTNKSEHPVHSFDFADTDFDGGVIFYEIVRSQSGWLERVIADGNKNTLNDFAKIYGAEIDKSILPTTTQIPPPITPTMKITQKNTEANSQITQLENNSLKKEINSLKQQLQLEQNQTKKLQLKCNRLILENNLLLEQQLGNSNLLPELLMLFSETLQYHYANTTLTNELKSYHNKLSNARNFNSILTVIEELRIWWNEYKTQHAPLFSFWRPDSWSRFEDKFPNNPITIKLKYFTK